MAYIRKEVTLEDGRIVSYQQAWNLAHPERAKATYKKSYYKDVERSRELHRAALKRWRTKLKEAKS